MKAKKISLQTGGKETLLQGSRDFLHWCHTIANVNEENKHVHNEGLSNEALSRQSVSGPLVCFVISKMRRICYRKEHLNVK